MFKVTLAENAVKEKTLNSVKQKIEREMSKNADMVYKKTAFYVSWSLAGILLLVAPLPKTVFYVAFVGMMAWAIFLMAGFYQQMKKFLIFINHFDQRIKQMVEKEINTQREKSVKNKIGLWLSGQSRQDIENLCISYSVRQFIRHFNQHKRSILARITAYTIAALLFKEALFYLFSHLF